MKKIRWCPLIVGLLVLALLLLVFEFSADRAKERQAEQARQAEYQRVVKQYSDALRPGLTRPEVESYLQSKSRSFRQTCCIGEHRDAWADLVVIGHEKAPWYCSELDVYVAFEFAGTETREALRTDARASDKLVSVSLFPQLGGCL